MQVDGDIDLSRLAATPISGELQVRLAGLDVPRRELELQDLERQLGRRVPGARVVREQIVIANSIILGSLRGPSPSDVRASPFHPLALLQRVDLSGTTIKGNVDLRFVRFRSPLIAEYTEFSSPVDLRGARFADNAVFRGATFREDARFRGVVFEQSANFEGVEFSETATANFRDTRFKRGAWFQSGDRTARLRNIDFEDSEVQDLPALFDQAVFNGQARFRKTRFSAGAQFLRADFSDAAQFDGASFAGQVRFSRASFRKDADFPRTVFEGTTWASFDGTEFFTLAVFDGARFAGPVQFTAARFHSGASFLDVSFQRDADFRRAKFDGAVEFGDPERKTKFSGPAAFDGAVLRGANFENAQFADRATFTSTQFGETTGCSAGLRVVVNFGGAEFLELADFASAEFLGLVNLPHAAPAPGKARLRWRQIHDRLISQPLRFDPAPACGFRKVFEDDTTRRTIPRVDVLRWLERNSRAQGMLGDANKALYELEKEEQWTILRSSDASWSERAVSLLSLLLYGYPTGFGVLPSHVIATLALALVAFAFLIYWKARDRLRSSTSYDSHVTLLTASLPWSPFDTLAQPGRRTWALAWWVSLAALLGVQVNGAYLLLSRADRAWWILAVERSLGYALIILFAHTLANSIPGLEKLLGWLPGI